MNSNNQSSLLLQQRQVTETISWLRQNKRQASNDLDYWRLIHLERYLIAERGRIQKHIQRQRAEGKLQPVAA